MHGDPKRLATDVIGIVAVLLAGARISSRFERNSEWKEDRMVDLDKYYKEMTPSSVTVWVDKPEAAGELVKQFKKEWGHIFWEIVSRENSEGEKEVTLYVLKISEQSRGSVGS